MKTNPAQRSIIANAGENIRHHANLAKPPKFIAWFIILLHVVRVGPPNPRKLNFEAGLLNNKQNSRKRKLDN